MKVSKKDVGKLARLPTGEVGRIFKVIPGKLVLVEIDGQYLLGCHPEVVTLIENEKSNKKERKRKRYIELPPQKKNFPPYEAGL